MQIHVPVSAGELLDKISILRIKAARIADEAKLRNVCRELEVLEPELKRLPATEDQLTAWFAGLAEVNGRLWEIEDDIRRCDAQGNFGEGFVRLARAVYRTNDERARIKREINEATGSDLVEEKSYEEYGEG